MCSEFTQLIVWCILRLFGLLNCSPFSKVGNCEWFVVRRRSKWVFSGPFGVERSVDGYGWRKLGCCCLKWLLLAFHSVLFSLYSTSMKATVSSIPIFTAIFMGALGNITARREENSREDREMKWGLSTDRAARKDPAAWLFVHPAGFSGSAHWSVEVWGRRGIGGAVPGL